ncbi:MAG: endonuclease Q family protein [Candidatus Micrarchaeota archaeon]
MTKVIADFHVHSKYARATSGRCEPDGLAEGAKIKGINVMATGDFTHPLYFEELKAKLKNEENGLYNYKGIKFIFSVEVAIFYWVKNVSKKMHLVILAPNLEVAEQINEMLSKRGNLSADGRPMFKFEPSEMVYELQKISKEIFIIPAHIWTPHFSLFGSNSGVDSIEEAFQDQSKNIFALETGLSSDPVMNWMISALDRYALISNSDAHSIDKLGREANVFDLENVSYSSLINAIKTRKGFVKTYEFYPEEGKYHYDGHRDCKVVLSPFESKKCGGICPVCKRKLTIGVMNRVAELADRKYGFKPENAVPFKYVVPLKTVISKILKKGELSVHVNEEYSKIVTYFGNEFSVYEASDEQIRLATSPEIANAIKRVNVGEVKWVPGHDGVFGELSFEEVTKPGQVSVDKKQRTLDDF